MGAVKRLAAAVMIAAAAIGSSINVSFAQDDNPPNGLSAYQIEGWFIEVVRDGDRAACSLLREDEGGAALVVSRVSDSPFVLPVMEIIGASDPLGVGPVAMAADGARTGVELDTSFDEDGVYIAAYPTIDRADAMIEAMQTATSLRLEQGGAVIATMPLAGFAAAYAEIAQVCGG